MTPACQSSSIRIGQSHDQLHLDRMSGVDDGLAWTTFAIGGAPLALVVLLLPAGGGAGAVTYGLQDAEQNHLNIGLKCRESGQTWGTGPRLSE